LLGLLRGKAACKSITRAKFDAGVVVKFASRGNKINKQDPRPIESRHNQPSALYNCSTFFCNSPAIHSGSLSVGN